jgi:hypothetical protein
LAENRRLQGTGGGGSGVGKRKERDFGGSGFQGGSGMGTCSTYRFFLYRENLVFKGRGRLAAKGSGRMKDSLNGAIIVRAAAEIARKSLTDIISRGLGILS